LTDDVPRGIKTSAVVADYHDEMSILAGQMDRRLPAKRMAQDIADGLPENQVDLASLFKIDLLVLKQANHPEVQFHSRSAEDLVSESPHPTGKVPQPIQVSIEGPDDIANRVEQFA
jgi:hypothetical protein